MHQGGHGDGVEGSPRLRWLLAAGKGSASRCATLACPCAAALHLGSLASTTMAAPQGPGCKLRLLTIHRYEPGISKGGHNPCAIEHLGRRGKPVRKQRFIPAEKAFAFARKLQGQPQGPLEVCPGSPSVSCLAVESHQVVHLTRGCEVARVGVSPPSPEPHTPCIATPWPD